MALSRWRLKRSLSVSATSRLLMKPVFLRSNWAKRLAIPVRFFSSTVAMSMNRSSSHPMSIS